MSKRYGIIVMAMAAVWIAGCATQENMPAGSGAQSSSGESRSVTASPANPASGTQGDSLQACMSRIPGGATAGQRMMAEQSCQRDETARKSILAVPGAK